MFSGIKTCNPKLKRKEFSRYLHTPMLIFTSEYNSVLKERENITSSMRVVPSLKKGTKINVFLALAHGLLVLNFSTLVCTALWSETILWGGGVNSE